MSWRDRADKVGRLLGHQISAGVSKLAAVVMLALIALMAGALISFNPADPSWNTTSLDATRNWLGAPGAIFADAVYQIMGHGVWLALLPMLAFALRRLRRQPVSHPNWRLIAGVFGVLLTSMALAIYGLAASPYAPFPGGAIGQELAEGLDAVLGAWSIYPSRVSEQLIAVALALIGLTLALISAAWLRASLAAIWRGLQNLRYTRQAIQAIGGLFARASWAAPLQRVGKFYACAASQLVMLRRRQMSAPM
jgi:hypothetical protein